MLYHKEIGLPDTLSLPVGVYKLKYSRHAQLSAKTDRYGDFSDSLRFHQSIDTSKASIIEVETFDNVKPNKIVYRLPLTGWPGYDIVIVVIPGEWVVKTVWINETSDRHKTLNRSKYASLPNRAPRA